MLQSQIYKALFFKLSFKTSFMYCLQKAAVTQTCFNKNGMSYITTVTVFDAPFPSRWRISAWVERISVSEPLWREQDKGEMGTFQIFWCKVWWYNKKPSTLIHGIFVRYVIRADISTFLACELGEYHLKQPMHSDEKSHFGLKSVYPH